MKACCREARCTLLDTCGCYRCHRVARQNTHSQVCPVVILWPSWSHTCYHPITEQWNLALYLYGYLLSLLACLQQKRFYAQDGSLLGKHQNLALGYLSQLVLEWALHASTLLRIVFSHPLVSVASRASKQ